MEIKQTISFGVIMLIENLLILGLLGDLIRRTGNKLQKVAHPHLIWNAGMIFLAYLLCVFLINVSETYTCFVNYILSDNPVAFGSLVARVCSRSLTLAAKALLWYYTVKGGFYLFRKAN